MQPSISDLYETKLITCPAAFPRYPGSVIIPQPSNDPDDYRLNICYRRYKTKSHVSEQPKINIVFLHGNGMNKGIWHYHIDKLYNHFNSHEKSKYRLNTVLAIDAVTHGQSAAVNKNKLGHVYGWKDGPRDVIDIVKNQESKDFFSQNAINILVGHSLGGFQALYTCFLEPELFDSCVTLNPVCYMDNETAELHLFALNMWHESGKIKSHFDIPEGSNWKEVVEHHYKKESFFKRFDSTVMANMLEDEFTDELKKNPDAKYKTIDLNTPSTQEYMCYYNAQLFIPQGMEVFHQITTPVYHIVGDNDTAGQRAVESTRNVLQSVIKPIDIENSTHIVLGENPDLVVNELVKAIDDNIEIHRKNGDIRYKEPKLFEKYGKDYRNTLIAEEYDVYTTASKNGTKLYKL